MDLTSVILQGGIGGAVIAVVIIFVKQQKEQIKLFLGELATTRASYFQQMNTQQEK